MQKLIYIVAGARPNFIKIAAIIRALQLASDRFDFQLINTGQNYDREMSNVFFEEIGIHQTAKAVLQGHTKQGKGPELWDCMVAKRIFKQLGFCLG